jgi:hypothetical protein
MHAMRVKVSATRSTPSSAAARDQRATVLHIPRIPSAATRVSSAAGIDPARLPSSIIERHSAS